METQIHYKLRVDTDSYEWCHDFVGRYADQYLFAMEMVNTENQHAHFYLQVKADCKEAAMRQHIRRTIGTGNGKYSLKQLTEALPIAYCSYVLKQETDKGKYFHNLGEPYILACQEYNKQVKEEIKAKKEAKKSLRHRIMEAYENHREELRSKAIDANIKYEPDDTNFVDRYDAIQSIDVAYTQMGQQFIPENRTLKDTLQWIINYYKENDELINCNQIKNFADTILVKYYSGHDKYLIEKMTRF